MSEFIMQYWLVWSVLSVASLASLFHVAWRQSRSDSKPLLVKGAETIWTGTVKQAVVSAVLLLVSGSLLGAALGIGLTHSLGLPV